MPLMGVSHFNHLARYEQDLAQVTSTTRLKKFSRSPSKFYSFLLIDATLRNYNLFPQSTKFATEWVLKFLRVLTQYWFLEFTFEC